MTLAPATREKALSVLRDAIRLDVPEKFWVSMHAAEGLTLGGYGAEVIPAVEPKLATEKDAQKRCGLARELVRAGQRERVELMTDILKSDDSYGHTHAAESLFKVFEVGDEATMRTRFKESDNVKVRLMAAAALARKSSDPAAYTFLRETLDGDDPEGVQIAAWVLGVVGDERDIAPLRRRLDDAPTPLIRAYIANALAALGDPDGLARLIRNLDDPDPAIRAYAATFAGDAKAVSAQPRLEAMLDDADPDARVRAAQTLLQLSRVEP